MVAAEDDGPTAVRDVAIEGAEGGQNGGVFSELVSPRGDAAGEAGAGAAAVAAAWSDTRPMPAQLSSYPATCLLAAIFVTVSRGGSE